MVPFLSVSVAPHYTAVCIESQLPHPISRWHLALVAEDPTSPHTVDLASGQRPFQAQLAEQAHLAYGDRSLVVDREITEEQRGEPATERHA